MSHQGINDCELQIALAEAFTTLCPELVFIHNNLEKWRSIVYELYDTESTDPKTRIEAKTEIETIAINTKVQNSDGSTGHDQANTQQIAVTTHNKPILKIGFISSHFYDHSIGRILIELFLYIQNYRVTMYNRIYDIQLIIYLIERGAVMQRNNINSTQEKPQTAHKLHDDVITQILEENLGDNFKRIPENITQMREIVTEENLDFLCFADVGMDFPSYSLAFSRLAIYQVIRVLHLLCIL